MIAAAPQGAGQDPDPGLPGDEGPLRSQALVPQLPDAILTKVRDANAVFFDSPNVAFSTFRSALRDARETGAPLLLAIDAGSRAPRLFCDFTVFMRRQAAQLSQKALEQYLSDAAPASSEIFGSVTLNETIARAGAFPRTENAARAYALAAATLFERGDLVGARSVILRILRSGYGTTAERAGWWAAERAAAADLGDTGLPGEITEEEWKQNIKNGAGETALRTFVASLRSETASAPSSITTNSVKERWRFPVPSPSAKISLSEPIERAAVEMDQDIIIQSTTDLFIINSATGAPRSERIVLDPTANAADATAPNDNDRKLAFLGKRRARPSADGRFLVVTAGGTVWVFEKKPDGLHKLWSRAAGKTVAAPGGDPKNTENQFYCDGALALGGRIFVTSIQLGVDTTTSIEAYDAATGALLFKRSLAKGSTAGARDERRFVGRVDAVVPQPLVYCNGAIFVATELGIVTSIDPLDGEILYSMRIQRSPQPQGYEAGVPACADGIVYLSPADSDYIYAFETFLRSDETAAAAPLPFAFDRAPQRRRDALFTKMAGAIDSRAILYGREQQIRRTLTSFDFHPKTRTLDHLPMGPGEDVSGLPMIINHYIFVPTNHGVTVYDGRRPLRDLLQIPLPVDPATRLPLRGDDALGDLTKVAGGFVSAGRDWIICYDLK